MLEVVARERLVKAWQTGKRLSGSVMNCECWKLVVAL
jgi:hypothetical protein